MDLPLKLGLARLAHGVSPASVAQAYLRLADAPGRSRRPSRPSWHPAPCDKALQWQHYATDSWRGDCEPCVEPLPEDKRFSRARVAGAAVRPHGAGLPAAAAVVAARRRPACAACRATTRRWSPSPCGSGWTCGRPRISFATNPQVLKEDAGTGWAEPGARASRTGRATRWPCSATAGRAAWRSSCPAARGADAGQGRLPQPPDRADPVRARDARTWTRSRCSSCRRGS